MPNKKAYIIMHSDGCYDRNADDFHVCFSETSARNAFRQVLEKLWKRMEEYNGRVMAERQPRRSSNIWQNTKKAVERRNKMSHSINFYKFPKETRESAMRDVIALTIEEQLDDEYEDFEPEDNAHDDLASWTANDLTLKDRYFDSDEEAEDYLGKSVSSGSLGVKVWEPAKKSSTIERLDNQVRREKAKLAKYAEDQHISNHKSQFIGCPKCQSKVNKDYIPDTDRCPVCHTLLLSNTAQETIKRYKGNITKWSKQAEDARSKQKRSWYWFVMSDYHT